MSRIEGVCSYLLNDAEPTCWKLAAEVQRRTPEAEQFGHNFPGATKAAAEIEKTQMPSLAGLKPRVQKFPVSTTGFNRWFCKPGLEHPRPLSEALVDAQKKCDGYERGHDRPIRGRLKQNP